MTAPRRVAPARVLTALEVQMADVIAAHNDAYHPGRDCWENDRAQCIDWFGVDVIRAVDEAAGEEGEQR